MRLCDLCKRPLGNYVMELDEAIRYGSVDTCDICCKKIEVATREIMQQIKDEVETEATPTLSRTPEPMVEVAPTTLWDWIKKWW